MSFDQLMTVKEVAELLRVTRQTIYKMVEGGQLPAVRVGTQWRFDRERVLRWVNSGGNPEPTSESES